MKYFVSLAIAMAAVSLAGCANESGFPEATGKSNIRAINAISTSPTFSFLIEERSIDTIAYKAASSLASYDDLEYTFNFEVVLAGDLSQTRVASQFLDVQADKNYIFIVSGALAAPDITLWESDAREWTETETVFESQFGHTAASLGDIDVYFALDGVAPAPGAAIGTLAFGEFLPAMEFAEGSYVFTITTAGDETDVLFVSNAIPLTARNSLLFSVYDGDGNDFTEWSAGLYNLNAGGSSLLVDANSATLARFFHTSKDFGATDIYSDDPLTTPLLANQTFGDISAELPVPFGALPLTYTTASNMGSILFELDTGVAAGSRNYYYLVRTPDGNDVLVESRPDRRSIETAGKLSIINTTASQPAVDVYVVPRGELIDEVFPLIPFLPIAADPAQRLLAAGSYDVYVTVTAEKTVLAGPTPLDVALGDILDAVIYENVDPNIVDIVFIPIP